VEGRTYNIVLDTVNPWVQGPNGRGVLALPTRSGNFMMRDFAHLQHTRFMERPFRELPGKSAIRCFGVLSIQCLDTRIEPLVLEHLEGAEDHEARRIVRLHRRDQSELRAGCEKVFGVLRIIFRVVHIRRRRCFQDWCKQWAGVAEDLADWPWECKYAIAAKEVFDTRSQSARAREEQDIMLFGRGEGIIVDVVDNDGGAVWRERYVELK
jgi:hypothetical protein